MSKTVVEHVVARLNTLGIRDFFGVPGDFVYPILDAICEDSMSSWIGSCNELNAAYAADGYARVNGAAALCTTYGAGELSAMNGLAAAYAEFSTVFHIVGMPSTELDEGLTMHHMLGDQGRDAFLQMAEKINCATAILSPENCVAELERLIAAALYHRRPVYLGIPFDTATKSVVDSWTQGEDRAHTNSDNLEAAVRDIAERVQNATSPCVLPGIKITRFGNRKAATDFINLTGLPYATSFQDKSVIDETNRQYTGMYMGALANADVTSFIESSDCIIKIGTESNYFNTALHSSTIDDSECICIEPHYVRIGDCHYAEIEMGDILRALAQRIVPSDHKNIPKPEALYPVATWNPDDEVTGGAELYGRLNEFLRPGDMIITDPSSAVFGTIGFHLPAGATVENLIQWGAIGWGTPAAFGAAIADRSRRVIMIGGDGAHQMTAQELGQFYRYGLKPIIIVINNDGYLVERYTCKNPEFEYNDLSQWNYADLPAAFGCKNWHAVRVATNGELDDALEIASRGYKAVYIEIVTDRYSMPPMGDLMFNATRAKFGQSTSWDDWKADYDSRRRS